jgi:hypothetical protein
MARKRKISRARSNGRSSITAKREEAVRLLMGMTPRQRDLTMKLYERTVRLTAK